MPEPVMKDPCAPAIDQVSGEKNGLLGIGETGLKFGDGFSAMSLLQEGQDR
jgi:hypothetical protein